jgi:hypothetical protein
MTRVVTTWGIDNEKSVKELRLQTWHTTCLNIKLNCYKNKMRDSIYRIFDTVIRN